MGYKLTPSLRGNTFGLHRQHCYKAWIVLNKCASWGSRGCFIYSWGRRKPCCRLFANTGNPWTDRHGV